ncbi:putative ABC transport system permease protein [Halohasta litchfieldiae]|jgi:putative ABC transport system permease protein|uniref:Putative ABC transport system permease protein n=1 Tax=Halohasta litchfieldiae TaxID=1073996 RepID=A0A1H6UUC2_9EURY|nr:FtsX-like permease family protein [Halohasta litchfieldiae]ATW88368.1 putative ABC transport system permease protein [Halohasta litchfieldiae]SEI95811.1 putative ABC transport system permease protein [Halohasta litchfieldiae]
MDSRESLRIAIRSIRAHKLRSALTVLGVVIGIASVITFATFGASVQAEIVGDIGDSSAGNIYIFGTPEGDEGFDRTFQPVFTESDVDRIRAIEGVDAVLPRGIIQVGSVRQGNQTLARQQVTATTPASITPDSIVSGRTFTSGEEEVVVNERMAEAFSENLTAGSTLTMVMPNGEEREVTVTGVVSGTRGELPISDFARQPRVYAPIDPFYNSVVESPSAGVRQRAYPQVTVVSDPRQIPATKAAIEGYLSTDSDARQLSAADTELVARSGSDFVDEISDVIERITRFVTGIGVISLVVGAIGIANVMLVSVTERTREIGIMKAVGARNRDVMGVFIIEAALLGTLGSLLGVPLGLVVGFGATRYADVGFSLAPSWMALAVIVGIVVGVVAGLYPAWRAARVDPIDALRHE